MTRTAAATLCAAAAMLLVGTSAAVSALIADYPVLFGQAVRFAIAAAILMVVLAVQRAPRIRLTLRDVLLLIALAGTGLVGFNLFLIEATRHASPALIGSVVGAVPIVLALAGPVLQRRWPSRRVVIAAVVVAAGTAVAAGWGSGDLLGLLLALGAMLCEVLFSLLAVPLLPKLGATRVSAYAAVAAVPMLLIAGWLTGEVAALRVPTGVEMTAFVYLGIVVTAVAFLLWYSALRRLGPDRAGLFAGLVPVGALVTTAILAIAPVSGAEILGAALIAAGIVYGMRVPRDSAQEDAPERKVAAPE
ncbi:MULTISPECIES: DMT family transporter [unclassified Microbacterium]|uniref:DMT family transporter n=1 Tax=unclassified Microbacterium TaxID=2609290 RepID=UPI0012FBCAFA|nr:DMT family transporter [Microbacterium sp. MAH-37]MVQ43140.1 EamA family transporter [Microbacterium sp. MAH-37]